MIHVKDIRYCTPPFSKQPIQSVFVISLLLSHILLLYMLVSKCIL